MAGSQFSESLGDWLRSAMVAGLSRTAISSMRRSRARVRRSPRFRSRSAMSPERESRSEWESILVWMRGVGRQWSSGGTMSTSFLMASA